MRIYVEKYIEDILRARDRDGHSLDCPARRYFHKTFKNAHLSVSLEVELRAFLKPLEHYDKNVSSCLRGGGVVIMVPRGLNPSAGLRKSLGSASQ